MSGRKSIECGLIAVIAGVFSSCAPKMIFIPPTGGQMGGVVLETPCHAGETADRCIATQRPSLRLTIPGQQTGGRVSPDGATLIATLGSVLNPGVMAFDLNTRRSIWQAETVSDWGASVYDYFFIDPTNVAFLGSHLVVVDAKSGRMLWRFPEKPLDSGDVSNAISRSVTAMFDRAGSAFILLHEDRVLLLDATTGTLLASRERMSPLSPDITAGPARWNPGEAYFYDSGLIRLDRQERKFAWGTRFATFARDDHKGANIARGVADAIKSVVTLTPSMGDSASPPEYRAGRTAPAEPADRFVLASGVGLVHLVDRQTGQPVWSVDLGVPQIAEMVINQDRVFILGGGRFAFSTGNAAVSTGEVRDPVRYGLWCLKLADGTPVASFQSPFNTNSVSRSLKAKDALNWDEDDAWEEEEDWISAGEKFVSGKHKIPTNLPYSYTRLLGLAMTNGGLLVVGTDRVWLVDSDSGREVESFSLTPFGTAVGAAKLKQGFLVRTTEGFVFFAKDNGRPTSSIRIEPASTNEAILLITPASRLAGPDNPAPLFTPNLIPSRSAWMSQEILKPGGYWVSPDGEEIIVCALGPKVIAFDIVTAKKLWELPAVIKPGNSDFSKTPSSFAGKIPNKNMPLEQKAMFDKKTIPTAITIDTYENLQILYLASGSSLEVYILPSRS